MIRVTSPIETPGDNIEESPVILVVTHGSTTSAMRRTVLEGLAGRPRDVVIDLRSVMSMTNPGLAVLVGTKARLQARRRRLTLVFGPRSATAVALSRSGLRGSFTTADSVAAAQSLGDRPHATNRPPNSRRTIALGSIGPGECSGRHRDPGLDR